ncbi:MAG: hypothetical protein PHS81_04645 [Candidatus Nanoarchaeia archaeon]|nr:hypothetical protein [Candidatus Nanoarchaeia archaeon]
MPIVFCGIEIRTLAINTQVKAGEIASHYLYITNNDAWSKTATIYLLTEKLYGIEPSYYLELPANSETTAKIMISVPSNALPQRYYEDVFIKFSDFTQATQRISYDVRGPELYLQLKNMNVEQEIDPLSPFSATLSIENNYFEKAKTATVQINVYNELGSSVYFESRTIDLLEGLNDYELIINMGQELRDDYVTVEISVNWHDLCLGILERTATISESIRGIEKSFQGNEIIISNAGSSPTQAFIQEKNISFIESLLINSATVPYTVTFSKILYRVPEILPGESITLSYELNYIIPMLFLIAASAFAYFILTKSIKIKKEIKNIKPMHNSLDFKVVLDISNVSKDKIEYLRIKEFLPSIITEVYNFGTVNGEIKTHGKQRFVQWQIKNLKPSESIALSYRAKTKVGFLGELRLDKSFAEILDKELKPIKKIKTPALILDINSKKKKEKK